MCPVANGHVFCLECVLCVAEVRLWGSWGLGEDHPVANADHNIEAASQQPYIRDSLLIGKLS